MNKGVPFILAGIKTKEFAVIDVESTAMADGTDMGFTTDLEFKIDTKNKVIYNLVKTTFLYEGRPFIVLSVECAFNIISDAFESFKNDKEGYTFPKGLITHLAVLTIGTSRGVLHAKLSDTYPKLSHLIMPTVNVNNIIIEDLVVEMSGRQTATN